MDGAQWKQVSQLKYMTGMHNIFVRMQLAGVSQKFAVHCNIQPISDGYLCHATDLTKNSAKIAEEAAKRFIRAVL